MIETADPSLLIVVSAPSGAGKTTLCDRLLSELPTLRYSISCTTRNPRLGEVDGEDYLFVEEDRFEELIKAGSFIEHAVVHGNCYGTLRETVDGFFEEGFDVLLDIDVQGAAQIRAMVETLDADDPLRMGFMDVFIAPPSLEVLRTRLEGRGQDSVEVIERRMENAKHEMEQAELFGYHVVNDDLDSSYLALHKLITKKKQCITPSH